MDSAPVMPTEERKLRELLNAILSVCTVEEFTLCGADRPVLAYRLMMSRHIVVDKQHVDVIRDRVAKIVEEV